MGTIVPCLAKKINVHWENCHEEKIIFILEKFCYKLLGL
jgi:hypothetical protein